MRNVNPSRKNDYKYRRTVAAWDRPPKVDLSLSVLEMRRVYSDLSDEEFITWYSSRYKVRSRVVSSILGRGKQ